MSFAYLSQRSGLCRVVAIVSGSRLAMKILHGMGDSGEPIYIPSLGIHTLFFNWKSVFLTQNSANCRIYSIFRYVRCWHEFFFFFFRISFNWRVNLVHMLNPLQSTIAFIVNFVDSQRYLYQPKHCNGQYWCCESVHQRASRTLTPTYFHCSFLHLILQKQFHVTPTSECVDSWELWTS